MPHTSSASDVLGIGTLTLVILCCIVGAFCLAYVLFFHFQIGKERQHLLRDFDSPWAVRTVLVCLSMLWTLGELFRLPWLREKDRLLHNIGINAQANLCRFHVVWSVGLTEPGLLLTVLFLVQGSLQEVPRHLNCRVLVLMFLSCLPVFVLQSALAATGHGDPRKESNGKLPFYFTRSFEIVVEAEDNELALCNYPLFSILALGVFSIVFMFYFARLGYRMLCHVINRRLRMRVYLLLLAVLLFVPLHVSLLGITVRLNPDRPSHEILMFLGFLTFLLCIAAAIGVLVVLPVGDAIAVRCLFRSRDQGGQSFSASPVEVLGRALSGVVSDEEDWPHNGDRRCLLGLPASIGTDIGSSSREGSLTFETGPRDLTLGPGGWLATVPGAITSPPSPVLLGRPLTCSDY